MGPFTRRQAVTIIDVMVEEVLPLVDSAIDHPARERMKRTRCGISKSPEIQNPAASVGSPEREIRRAPEARGHPEEQ